MKGPEILYRERLTPRPYVYLVVEALLVMISLAYGAPFGARVGWVVFVGGTILAVWALIATSPVIEVTATHLHAGPARIERSLIDSATPLDRDAFHRARGREADPRRFSVIRSWHSGSGAIVTINDPRDPHPAWILTTARPQELATALA